MTLIDEDRATELYDLMGPAVEISGGSAANTIVGVASFGGRAQYLGKVRDDLLGRVFAHDIRATGVRYETDLADRRTEHRMLPHPGHARRPADHEHLPRGIGPLRTGRRRRRRHRPGSGAVPRGVPLRSARTAQEAFRRGGPPRPRGRSGRCRRPCPTASASSATTPPSSTWSRTTSTSSSPTRPRSRRCTRPTTSTTRSSRSVAAGPSPR